MRKTNYRGAGRCPGPRIAKKKCLINPRETLVCQKGNRPYRLLVNKKRKTTAIKHRGE